MADPAVASTKRPRVAPIQEGRELHLYPGDKRLLYMVNGKLAASVEAWGGPANAVPKRPGEPFGATPTPAGRFRIGWIGPYKTSSWKWSKLRWGARLRRHPVDEHDLLFEESGRWHSVWARTALTRGDIETRHLQLYGLRTYPPIWNFNDFGPIAVRFYNDRNANRKRDANEPLEGEMFHTTAENEAEGGNTVLYESHGCIHLRPIERDRLLALDAFQKGTLLIIYKYSESIPGTLEPTGAP